MGILDTLRQMALRQRQAMMPSAPFVPTPVAGQYTGVPGAKTNPQAGAPIPVPMQPMQPSYMMSTPAGRKGMMGSIAGAFNAGAGGGMDMYKLNGMMGG